MNDAFIAALQFAHSEGLHGEDPSRYWENTGCPSCYAERTDRIITAQAAARAEAEAEALIERLAADVRGARERREAARERREASRPVYTLSRHSLNS